MARYFKYLGSNAREQRYSDAPYSTFEYVAFSDKDVDTSDPRAVIPFARIEGHHRYAQYAPSFRPSSPVTAKGESPRPDWGGTTDQFRTHAHTRLAQASYDRALTDQEKDAVDAIRVTKRLPVSEGRDEAWANEQFKTNPHLIPDQLFHESKPAKTHIGVMFSDPSMTSSAMTLVGAAYRDHANAPIEADDDLSKYSSKLVQNAVQRGLPVIPSPNNPTAGITNSLRFDSNTMNYQHARRRYHNNPEVKEMGPSEVTASRQTVRGMLRGRKSRDSRTVPKTNLSQQFLPGMEDFV